MKKLFFTLLLLFPIITSAQSSWNMNLLGTYETLPETNPTNNMPLFYRYDDGSVEKRIVLSN